MTSSRPRPSLLVLEALEDRLTPAISFGGGSSYNIGNDGNGVAAGDLNGDGFDDVVFSTGTTNLTAFLSDASGNLTPVSGGVAVSDRRAHLLADVNGDNKLDIVAAAGGNQRLVVALGNGDGTFQSPVSFATGNTALDLAVADFDGDGRLDVVVANDGVALFRNTGTAGLFAPAVQLAPGGGNAFIGTGDFNGDGKPDIVTSVYSDNKVRVLLNTGTGAFAAPVAYNLNGHAARVTTGDFDRNGRADVVVAYGGQDTIAVLLANTDGTLRPLVEYALPGSSGGLAVADFDLDGKLDLAAAGFGRSRTFVYAGNGDGTLAAPIEVASGTNPAGLASGDFNGDGRPDLASAVSTSPAALMITLNTSTVSLGSFAVSVPATATAGLPVSVTVTARTTGGVAFIGFTGTVQLTVTDGLATFPAAVTFTAADRGVKTITVTFSTPGPQTLTVTEGVTGATGTSGAVSVVPVTFTVNAPAYAAAGLPVPVTVTARAADGSTLVGFTGTVQLTVTDGAATFPATVTFTTADHGAKMAIVTFNTGGAQAVTATDMTTGITATSDSVVVSPASFAVAVPATATVGQPVTVIVTARTGTGTTFPTFAGTVQLTVTDGSAIFPATVTFTAADAGVKAVTVTFKTVGNQTVTATEAATGATGASVPVAVALGTFAVTAPAGAVAGEPVTVIVSARAADGAAFTGYTGTVQLTSTDGLATFPATVTFAPGDFGVKSVTVTFRTAGARRVTATDPLTGATGDSGSVTVTDPLPVVTQAASVVTLTALDGPTVFGDAARFLIAVAPVAGQPVPTGTVTFTDVATNRVLGSVPLDGTGRAVWSTASLPAGTNTVAASYSGDTNYQSAAGATAVQVVDRQARVAVGSDAGPVTTVQVFDPRTGALLQTLFPFELYTGGAKVAVGDINNDGTADIVVSAGAGAPGGHVKVYSGANYAVIASFFTFPGYTGGVNVAAGDVDNDGFADVVVGTAIANDHVKAFSGRLLLGGASADFSTLMSFFAYGGGNLVGVTVGTGDVDGDGRADVITGSARAAGHVKAFQALTGQLIGSYFAYGAGYLGGIFVAGGDVDGDGRAEIITGATNAPHVKVLTRTGEERASFYAYRNADGTPAAFGVRVGAVDRNGDRLADVLTGAGGAAPAVKVFSGLDPTQLIESFIANPGGQPSPAGIFVSGSSK